MARRIYRVVSACGALGYGFPGQSLREAIKDGVDAIVADAGSMDAGPYYLGAGVSYFDREAVKADYRHMVEAGLVTGSPVIVGSCGMAGADGNLNWMLDVAKEVFSELNLQEAKVAVIHAELDPETVVREHHAGSLTALGAEPALSEGALRESTIVAQMGIHPIMSALNSGAQYIFAGRSCDVALFAADMVRRGIDPGLAYHVGHILECGALACEPGSASDCLVAEVYDDGSALFSASGQSRLCTPLSIAAHSLYEESHPHLQYYPEGVLNLAQTEYFARDARSAGIRHSRFVRARKTWPMSVKLEGARWIGKRMVSLIQVEKEDAATLPADAVILGRNAVEPEPIVAGEQELGLLIEATAERPEAAILLARLLTGYLLHYGYSGRKSTAGNLAFPLSPNLISFTREDGVFGALVPAATRDSSFIENYPRIKAEVLRLVADIFPHALAQAQYRIIEASEESPVVLIRTIDTDLQTLAERHRADVDAIPRSRKAHAFLLTSVLAADAYEWSLYHLLTNERLIKDTLFPIVHYAAQGRSWLRTGEERPRYFEVGTVASDEDIDETLCMIEDAPRSLEEVQGSQRLSQMSLVIRSKNAGVNRLTFDIVFNSAADYEAALRSNLFFKDNIAMILGVSPEQIIGSYYVDPCHAIKVSIERSISCASPEERDVFGAQQQSRLERVRIPLFRPCLAKCSSL